MFVNLTDPPLHTQLVDATQMSAAQSLVAREWTVCSTYLDGYFGDTSEEAITAFDLSVQRAVSKLPEQCVLFTAGMSLHQDSLAWLVCSNSAQQGTGIVPIPYWFEDRSEPLPFGERQQFAGFQGTVASNRPLREAVVAGFADCSRSACNLNSEYFHAMDDRVQSALADSYWKGLSQTQFALCPRGDNSNSVRFYESLAAGCIPVLLADDVQLPLARILPWNDMIVRVPESDARSWQKYVFNWCAKRTDGELTQVSQHNRETWQSWFHWSKLCNQLLVERIDRAIDFAERRCSLLTREALTLPGMSSGKVRHLLNNLRPKRYLEVGVWQGATFVAACFGRRVESATAIDNFSQFSDGVDGPDRFRKNMSAYLADQAVTLHASSFFDLSTEDLPTGIEVFFYDGDHRPEAQRRAISQVWQSLADQAIILVDDINYRDVLEQTRQGLSDVDADVIHEWHLPARFNGDTEQWWNGLYVAAVRKKLKT